MTAVLLWALWVYPISDGYNPYAQISAYFEKLEECQKVKTIVQETSNAYYRSQTRYQCIQAKYVVPKNANQ